MAPFSRKIPEEKATQKAEKTGRDAKRKSLADSLTRTERMTHGSAINVTADEISLDETLTFLATGELDDHDAKAVLAATDQRIIIGWMKGLSIGHTEIRYSGIDQIDVGTKLSGKWVTLRHGSHSTTLEKSVSKNLDDLKRVVREQQAIPAAPADTSDVSNLAKLAERHAAGVLTDDEFTAAKAKALGL